MGKLLKVLVVFIFLLSIGAAVLTYLNAEKRKMMVERTHILEESIIKIAGTLEESDPVFEGVADNTEKDIDTVTDRVLDVPSTSSIWEGYPIDLEASGATLQLSGEASRVQLRRLYLLDGEGKPVKSDLGGYKTTGAGTMNELLTKVQDAAIKQQARLNKTRAQLKLVREQHNETINELNEQKKLRRQNLRTITELNQKITTLEAEKADLQQKVTALEAEKADLEDQVNSLKNDVARLDEENKDKAKQIADLQKQLEGIKNQNTVTEGGSKLTSGVKGRIVSADNTYGFVLVQLTDEAIAEIKGATEANKGKLDVELMVRRNGFDGPVGNFVTRLRLRSIRESQKIAVADNLDTWQQAPVQVEDEVFF